MKRAAYLRSIALFLIVLIINLTIYSSVVMAAVGDVSRSFIDISVSGADGVAGFKKDTDIIEINATVFIIAEKQNGEIGFTEIIPAQLSGTISDGRKFMSFDGCESIPGYNQASGLFSCFKTVSGPTTTQQQLTIDVKLNDSLGRILMPEGIISGTLTTDDKVPQIGSTFNIIQNSEGTFLVYDAADPRPSSGIARIELREDSRIINMTILNTASSLISSVSASNDRHKITSSARGTQTRVYELTVADRVGLETSKSIDVKTDYTKPEIIQNSFGIYMGEKLIHRLEPDKPTQVQVRVNVRDDSDLSFVRANLSQLNLGNLGEVDLGCTKHTPPVGAATGDVSDFTCIKDITAKIIQSTRNVRVKFTLKDNHGNENAAEPTYELAPETSAPQLILNSFKAVVNGIEVHHLAAKSAKVDFEAKIREEFPGMNLQDATLDLGNLDGTNGLALKSKAADKCEFNESLSVYSCGWNVTIEKPKKASGIVLNVKDTAAQPNAASIPISYSFGIDDVAPEVTFIGTTSKIAEGMKTSFESIMATGTNNLFIAEINEQHSGIAKENVQLSLRGVTGSVIGGSSTELVNLHPNQCVKKSNELYVCIWNQTEIFEDNNEAEYELTLAVSDNAKNTADRKTSKVFLDKTKPVIDKVSIVSISQQGPVDYHQSGDVLRVIAVVKDVSPVKMFADLSDLNAEDNITVDCVPEENAAFNAAIKWTCTAESRQGIGVFDPGDKQQRVLNIIAADAVGNEKNIRDEIKCEPPITGCIKLTQDKVSGAVVDTGVNAQLKVEVLKIEAKQPAPNFWQAGSIKPMPQALDRETFELINTRQYFSVKLNRISKPGQQADPLDVTLIKNSCKADETDVGKASFNIVKSFELQNNKGKIKDNPILFVEYQRAKPEFNELKFTCTFSILTQVTKAGTKFFIPQPEFENVTFVTKWFNLPIGTLDAALRDQIDDAKKKAFDDLGKTIDILSKVMAIAKGICMLYGVLVDIIALINAIDALGDIYDIITLGATKVATTSACTGTKLISEAAKGSWRDVGNKFCEYVSCRQTLPGLGDLLDGIYDKFSAGEGGGLEKTSTTFNVVTGKDAAGALSIKPDPMKSLSLAILMGCIPGIIAGAEKHRQIHCMHAYCLQKDVAGGLPIDVCHAQKGLLECKFVYGEWDSLLPWNWILDHFAGIIKTIFQNPLALIGAVIGYVCTPICKLSSAAASACIMATFVKISAKVYKDLDAIFQFSGKGKGGGLTAAFTPQNDMCKKLKELDKEEGN